MEEVLESLIKIKDLDEGIKKNEHLLKTIPEKIKNLQREIEKKKSHLNQAKNRLVEIKKLYKIKEGDILYNEEKVNKLNQQIYSVKTNVEYRALLKEIEFLKNARMKIEDEMIGLLEEEEEELKNALFTMEKETREFVENKNLELNGLNTEISCIMEEQEKKKSMLQDEVKRLPDDIRKIYERIKKARERPICTVKDNGVCTGCFSNLTPQVLNELKERSKILLCDNCGRIIIYEG